MDQTKYAQHEIAMIYVRVSLPVTHDEVPSEMYFEVTDDFTKVDRLIEIYPAGDVVFDDLRLHTSSETVFGINSLVEGDFTPKEHWTFDKDCFYREINEFEFNAVFEASKKVGKFRADLDPKFP